MGPARVSLSVAASALPRRPTLSSPAGSPGLPPVRALPQAGPRHPSSCASRGPASNHQMQLLATSGGKGVSLRLRGPPTAGWARTGAPVQAPPPAPLTALRLHSSPQRCSLWADHRAHQGSLLEARSLFQCAGQDRHPSAGPRPCPDPLATPAGRDNREAPARSCHHRSSTPTIRDQGEHPSWPGRSSRAGNPLGARTAPHSNVSPPRPSKVHLRTAGLSGPGLQPRPGPLPKPSAGAPEFPSASRPLHTGAPIFLCTARFICSRGN
ncbi:hypothetical protein NDU88_004848 [Pleurodeles waltl]|uniref:Uncharacterized protein n=1 Tax=Pleurodeles waltl TaxID=8319 RepID=A0AAV7TAA7_PLEWA|nr:hypothetical protein NDU88_004848 [Pleurodeles waltl]